MASKTKAGPRGQVWIGDLHHGVTEDVLRKKFAEFGPIHSCKIMTDKKTGRSKGFGYVNYKERNVAEMAARKLNNFKFNGKPIKLKGPSTLKKEGHLKKEKDYRALTDCSFFLTPKGCAKGKEVMMINETPPLHISVCIYSAPSDTVRLP
jgi:hypothetical protein